MIPSLLLSLSILAATPPERCQEAVDVSTPCAGTLVPYPMMRTLLACPIELSSERTARLLDAAEAEARLAEARRQEAAQHARAEGCQSLLGRCTTRPAARVEWWQGPEVVVSLLVVAVGALVAVVVLVVD
jgi:hypothetical protein